MLHVLILCIHKPYLSWKWNGKFTHNFFSVVPLICGLFRHYFNGSSYKLLSNEGEITESNKSLEEGSHTWFESTMWSYERRDWLKRWHLNSQCFIWDFNNLPMVYSTLQNMNRPVRFPKIGKGFTVQGIFVLTP